MPGRHQRAAAGSEHLQVDVVVPRIDRRHDRQRVVGGDQWRGESRQCRQPDGGFAGGERDAARRGNADTQAGEAAGPGGDSDAVECGKIEVAAREDARDQRHQCFGMAAHHRQRFMHVRVAALGVEHGDRAGFQRGIDGEDAHDGNCAASSIRESG